jgi:glycosyltransferase involved in cell wall biosynthesis
VQGWSRVFGLNITYKLANAVSKAKLVAVSYYTAATIGNSFNVHFDGIIQNPIKDCYLNQEDDNGICRCYITFVGRLSPEKNVHRLVSPIIKLLGENKELRVCIIGDGPQRKELECLFGKNNRIEFKGNVDDNTVRNCLRHTKIFISGNTTEGLGISYLEALSQGCIVAMPASGGGIELNLDQVGKQIQLLPISLEPNEVFAILKNALRVKCHLLDMQKYSAESVAKAYLGIDALPDNFVE